MNMPATKINIAIDGKSACGKSTLAKSLAQKLAYLYVDSGAMYRAVTLYFLKNQVPLSNHQAVSNALSEITIRFGKKNDGAWVTLLNDEDVETEIRTQMVSDWVSEVAAISAVRQKLVEEQKAIGRQKGVVMDGRDIGTIVFPEAELKIFLTADEEVRVQRRFLEMQQKGYPVNDSEIRTNLQKRDFIDTTRADSPLVQAIDAIMLDNSELTPTEQLDIAYEWAIKKIKKGSTHD
jgi:CMP/dCMP kinase